MSGDTLKRNNIMKGIEKGFGQIKSILYGIDKTVYEGYPTPPEVVELQSSLNNALQAYEAHTLPHLQKKIQSGAKK